MHAHPHVLTERSGSRVVSNRNLGRPSASSAHSSVVVTNALSGQGSPDLAIHSLLHPKIWTAIRRSNAGVADRIESAMGIQLRLPGLPACPRLTSRDPREQLRQLDRDKADARAETRMNLAAALIGGQCRRAAKVGP